MKASIHVGQGKTGTTSIQRFLSSNFSILLSNKIFYSMFLNQSHHSELSVFGEIQLRALTDKELVRQKLRSVNRFIEEHNIDRFIWSLESLFYNEIEMIQQIKNYLEIDDIEIVIFLRRQDFWFQSAFYQWGWKHKTYEGTYLIDFEKFYKSRHNLGYYDRFVENWATVFGEENIKIQPYEKEQLPKGLISAFCDMIGLNIPELNMNELYNYPNFDHYTSQIIGICNSMNYGQVYDADLLSLFEKNTPDYDYDFGNIFRKYSLISPARQLEILDKYDLSNQFVAKKFLKRDDGMLFYHPKPDPEEVWEPIEPFSLKHFIPRIYNILLKQDERTSILEDEIKLLRKRLIELNSNPDKL